jgi:hexosaminidase
MQSSSSREMAVLQNFAERITKYLDDTNCLNEQLLINSPRFIKDKIGFFIFSKKTKNVHFRINMCSMLKSIIKKMLVFVLGIILLTACQDPKKEIIFPVTDLTNENLIPYPLEVNATNSAFALDKNSIIQTTESDANFIELGYFLSRRIKDKIDVNISVNKYGPESKGKIIYINRIESDKLSNDEAYQLIITNDSVKINSSTAEGAFRGIQTLRQIIPETGNDTLAEQKMWLIPTGEITDEPIFEYRGVMLDVARHFFSVDDVKKYIEVLTYYKINKLHLHLTDDQGWRIEIKSWPKLTTVGGSTEVGGASGGFYTQEDYKEIVDYAAKRYITVIPEVDMPGHTNAASVSYPILNGNGKTPKLYTGTEVGFSTFDTRKDTVYAFIDDVIREISAITPGPYFHIGGDESHVTNKRDYIYFINKVEKIVHKYDKQMIGWDEIMTADVDSNAIAQYWADSKNALAAVKNKSKVILSPATKAYLDMKYDTLSKFGLHWAAYIPVDSAYIWNPEKLVDGITKKDILGIEAPLWSETISNIDELEYLAFPRVIGYTELSWSTDENRNWESYKIRLANQASFLNRMNVKFYRSDLIDWKEDTDVPIKP